MVRNIKVPSGDEYEEFNSAMDAILKADPAKVKAAMEAEKKEREEQRKTSSADRSRRPSGPVEARLKKP